MSGIYVLEFSDELIKVGRSSNCAHRIDVHREHAATFGIKIERCWVSKKHVNTWDTEAALIAFCRKQAKEVTRSEWFHGLKFSAVVAHAKTLDYDTNFAAYERQVEQRGEEVAMYLRTVLGWPEKPTNAVEELAALLQESGRQWDELYDCMTKRLAMSQKHINFLKDRLAMAMELIEQQEADIAQLQAKLASVGPTR